MSQPLLIVRPEGLYCAAGDFYVDPWRPVPRAVITHAHSDHARRGSDHYLATAASREILYRRLGDIRLQTVGYGEIIDHYGVRISLHPAGHILGSAQVRIEYQGETWVVSGDYKLENDGISEPFQPIACDCFVTESTFGLPVYQWQPQPVLRAQINEWWRQNAEAGRASVVYCYALGKAQRILNLLDAGIGPILTHGAVEPLTGFYRNAGVALPATLQVGGETDRNLFRQALVLAPPSARGTPWLKRFGDYADAMASGWMQIRGRRRMLSVDRGFVLSDHADWPGLLQAVAGTGAEKILVTHGYVQTLIAWLKRQGFDARALAAGYPADAETAAADA